MSRAGKFTSSQIYRLMSKGRGNWSVENTGKAFETYVKEKRWEIKLGRPINKENNARATAWGTLVEQQAFNNLSLKYVLDSKKRYHHSEHKQFWSGAPDLYVENVIGDIKCPWTLESFADLVDIIESEDVELFKKLKPEYYWQLVSNAILCDVENALFVAYVPYQTELSKIRELAENTEVIEPNKVAFINWAADNELPFIPNENKEVSNVNMFQFEVSKEDKEKLTKRIELAISKL